LYHFEGKFYEMYHMDADVGVQHCGFNYMNGHFAKSGFPEISYGVFADKLVRAGYKVARVEQTETPEQLDVRKKRYKGKGMPKVVNREICSVMTIGTRTFCFLDQSDGKGTGDAMEFDRAANPDDAGCLLAIREVLIPESHDELTHEKCGEYDEEEVLPVCEYGVVLIDAVRGTITIGQFADDVCRSRMLTLLSTFTPSEVSNHVCKLFN
jgi:DNA mismatch repair protein MSH6